LLQIGQHVLELVGPFIKIVLYQFQCVHFYGVFQCPATRSIHHLEAMVSLLRLRKKYRPQQANGNGTPDLRVVTTLRQLMEDLSSPKQQ
jgi:hypothetical protein